MTFYERLSAHYDEIFPLDSDRVSFCRRLLPPGGHILDLGAGTGTLVKALAESGFDARGIDADPSMVRRAADSRIVVGDLRALDSLPPGFQGPWDGILCLGNTLVHLDSLDTVRRVLADAAALSLPGGRMILQILNYDSLVRNRLSELPPLETARWSFHRHYDYLDNRRVRFTGTLVDKKSREQWSSSVDLLPLGRGDLVRALESAGWTGLDVFGGFQSQPLTEASLPLVVSARLS